jgi:hypothetical protein
MPHLLRHPAFLKNQTPQQVRGDTAKKAARPYHPPRTTYHPPSSYAKASEDGSNYESRTPTLHRHIAGQPGFVTLFEGGDGRAQEILNNQQIGDGMA